MSLPGLLDDMGDVPTSPARLRRLALRLARLVEAGGPLTVGQMRESLVECIRKPAKTPCPGFLRVAKLEDERLYAWCPICHGDEFYISDWQGSLFADGPCPPVSDADFPGSEKLD